MNNAIKTHTRVYGDVYARFDRFIDHYKTFAFSNAVTPISPLTRKQMNYMLIRSTIYNIPARVTHT